MIKGVVKHANYCNDVIVMAEGSRRALKKTKRLPKLCRPYYDLYFEIYVNLQKLNKKSILVKQC